MKKIYLLITVLMLCHSVFSQKKKEEYEFIGALTTSDQGIITYKVSLEEYENGKLQGVSVTDFYGENYTKSKLIGTINHKKKTISFKEIKNISTNSTEDANSFCFVNAENLKFKIIKGKTIVTGTFVGLYLNGKECASGNLYLASTNIINDIRSIVDTMKSDNDTLKKIKSILNEAGKPINGNQTIKKNNNLRISWSGDRIIFDVWDGNKEDNDMINIYVNGKLVEENLIIKNQKKTIDIPFKGETAFIRILAVNEGFEIPNTVNFMFKNGSNQNSFLSTLNKGEEFTIEFNRN